MIIFAPDNHFKPKPRRIVSKSKNGMKNFNSLLVSMMMVFGAVALTSCYGEEEELIEENTIAEYTEKIVGKWRMDNTQEYWRFDARGNGSVHYGENWNLGEDVHEGEGNDFQWEINSNGLMVIYAISGIYNVPEPDAPYTIKSITSSKMTWVTSGGTQQSLTRQ